MVKIINWIFWSSANKDKISLTIKAVVSGLIFTSVTNLIGIVVNPQDLADFSLLVIDTAEKFITVLAGLVAIYGFIRKAYLTIIGNNDVLK